MFAVPSPAVVSTNLISVGVRDAAITSSTLVSSFLDDPTSDVSSDIATFLDEYAALSKRIQHAPNPSGSFEDLSSLGEPKFNADGSPFEGSWGRPQRDGPALRAIALMEWLRAWNSTNPQLWTDGKPETQDWFDRLYYPELPANSAVKADLEYVSHLWPESGFDLWEEIQGRHFFTAMVQLRSLHEGARLADVFDDPGAARWYREQETKLRGFMHLFWDNKKGHLVETLAGDRSGLDCGVLLGAIHGLGEDEDSPYPPWADEVLATLHGLVKDQRERFPINSSPGMQRKSRRTKVTPLQRLSKWFSYFSTSPAVSILEHDYYDDHNDSYVLRGVGVGRYPEDVYDGIGSNGGNPWFLCTSAVAETLYRTASHLSSTSTLAITNVSLPFWRSILPESSPLRQSLQIGTYNAGSGARPNSNHVEAKTYAVALHRLRRIADSFLDVVKTHTAGDGSLSEQFDSITGFERGARDLTWSYGAFLDALRARKTLLSKLGMEIPKARRHSWWGWKSEM